MFSAFLEREDGSWSRTTDTQAVLDHPGDLLVNEHEDEESVNLQLLAERVGKAYGHCGQPTPTIRPFRLPDTITFTDHPLFWGLEDAFDHAQQFGICLARNTGCFRTETVGGQTVGVTKASEWWTDEAKAKHKQYDGWVLEPCGPYWKLSHNPGLAEQALTARTKAARRQELSQARQPVRKWDVECLADACSKALGTGTTKSFRIEQVWTWLAAHDAAFGRRATNTLALSVARKWCKDREASKKWLGRWSSDETVQRTDERFAAVCRQGKK